MRQPVIVDTNVPVTANGRAEQADSACVEACKNRLIVIRENGRVLVDRSRLIFDEYIQQKLSFRGQPGIGDVFFKWLWDNQAQEEICTMVDIAPDPADVTMFPNFPTDPDLATFDRSDRKFVATALASGEDPPIVNATDTDWWEYRDALERSGLIIEFLCPQMMEH